MILAHGVACWGLVLAGVGCQREGDGHGVFTYFLLKGLEGQADRDKNGLVTAGEIVEYVRSEVISARKDKQHPNPSGQYDRNLPLAVVGNN